MSNGSPFAETRDIVKAATTVVSGMASFVERTEPVFAYRPQVTRSMQVETKSFCPDEEDVFWYIHKYARPK